MWHTACSDNIERASFPLIGKEEPMQQAKRTSRGKRSKEALSVLSLAGISLAATTAATTNELLAGMPSPATAPVQAFTLGEEEISDVTLATFRLFEKESVDQSRSLLQLTRCGGCGRCGCGGGCRGCGGGRCGGCGFGRCGGCARCGGCGGCGCGGVWGGCCLSWGGCRPWC